LIHVTVDATISILPDVFDKLIRTSAAAHDLLGPVGGTSIDAHYLNLIGDLTQERIECLADELRAVEGRITEGEERREFRY